MGKQEPQTTQDAYSARSLWIPTAIAGVVIVAARVLRRHQPERGGGPHHQAGQGHHRHQPLPRAGHANGIGLGAAGGRGGHASRSRQRAGHRPAPRGHGPGGHHRSAAGRPRKPLARHERRRGRGSRGRRRRQRPAPEAGAGTADDGGTRLHPAPHGDRTLHLGRRGRPQRGLHPRHGGSPWPASSTTAWRPRPSATVRAQQRENRLQFAIEVGALGTAVVLFGLSFVPPLRASHASTAPSRMPRTRRRPPTAPRASSWPT